MLEEIPNKVINEIHNTIKYIWEYDIPRDYKNKLILKEDTLKNSIYFHIRTRLGSLLEKYNIMIFTEFNTDKFRKSGYRADMVLVQMDFTNNEFWGDCVKNFICVFELKFKRNFTSASDEIYKDYDKTKQYIKNLNLGKYCHYYIATIWECYTNSKWWLQNDVKWAKGKLTELNADHNSKGEMKFYIREHK